MSEYQKMTREVRALIRGLAWAYGEDPSDKTAVEWWHYWSAGDIETLDLAMLETELALIQELHPSTGLSCGPRKIHVAGDNFWARHNGSHVWSRDKTGRMCESGIHVLSFGAFDCTHVLAFGSLEDALEDAAAVLAEVAPGCFTEPDYAEARMEADEAARNAYAVAHYGASYYNITTGQRGEMRDNREAWQLDEDDERVHEHAETDLTYTESGYIASWEWRVTSFDSIAELLEWANEAR